MAEALGLRIDHQLAGGEFGAYAATTADGAPAILKRVPPDPRLHVDRVAGPLHLAETLRREGYPAPRFLDVGRVGGEIYTVQEACAGDVPDRLSEPHVHQLLELWRRHEGGGKRAGLPPLDWLGRLGGELDAARRLLADTGDAEPRAVTAKAIGLLDDSDPSVLRTTDAVHGDFHHRNLLADGDTVTAVFDWEGARVGDSRADVLRLASAAVGAGQVEPAGELLLHAAVEREVPRAVRAVLGAIQVLDDLRFGRYTKLDVVPWALRCADFLIGDL